MAKKKVIIVAILAALTVAFIFIQSTQSREASSSESKWVMQLLTPVLEVFVGEGNVTEHLVRKMAHFTEFCALGVELSLLLAFLKTVKVRCVANVFISCLLTALVDETIQIFSRRGPSIADVWLDCAGSALGIVVVIAVAAVISRRRAGG